MTSSSPPPPTLLLISPYWREKHRWMVSSVKLAELWQRIGYRVVVACMGEGTRVEDVSPTLRIYWRKDLFLPDPWNYGIALGFSRQVRHIIDIEKPELIIINKLLFWTSLSAITLRLRGHRVQVITDALVGMTWWPRGRIPKIASALYAWTLGWLVLLTAENIVFFHPQPPGLLRKLRIAEKARVIPTGIDGSRYSFVRSSITESGRKTHNEPTNNIVVTYIGRLESVKGVDDFLAAAVPLRRNYPEMHIQVVGWYKEGHPLVAQYKDDVTFTGLRDDIAQILSETDIFVLPSYSEGLSNALMEAMASGCACIASDVGGNRFLIQNGVSGLLFPAGDRAALTAHVRRLVEDPAKRRMMGGEARRRLEEHFDWSVVAKQYQEFFDGLQERSKIQNPKPHLVILSAFATPFRSGAEACAEEMAARMQGRFDITIITSKLRRDLPRHDRLPSGVTLLRLGLGMRIDPWLFPFLAPFAARRLQPHILHAVLETFAGLALHFCRWTVPGAKRLLTLQTLNRSFLKALVLRSPHRVTAISAALARQAREIGRPDALVIPNGIALKELEEACRMHAKVPGRILFVGRLRHMKGVDVLLRAFAEVVERHQSDGVSPSPHLRIVGDGPDRSSLERLARTLGIERRVTFAGAVPVSGIHDEYAKAQIFCGLSRSEALGNVFLEAQAAECAVVATRVGGIPEVVEDGETGLLVEAEDPNAAADAIHRLLTDVSLRERCAAAGCKHAQEFGWDAIARKYEALYDQRPHGTRS